MFTKAFKEHFLGVGLNGSPAISFHSWLGYDEVLLRQRSEQL